jgi:hypothetical protein
VLATTETRACRTRRSSAKPKASSTGLSEALGYRVEADGDVGVVVGVPLAGHPPRPLVLVVRDGDCMRFVSVRRVASVLRDERRVLLCPAEVRHER